MVTIDFFVDRKKIKALDCNLFEFSPFVGAVTMSCLNCDKNLAGDSQILFYYKNEKTVYLTIKPEWEVSFEESETVLIHNETKATKETITCRKCDTTVEMVLPFGPSNRHLKTFTYTKMKLENVSYAGQKLYNVYKKLPIETCDTKEIFKDFTPNKNTGRSLVRKKIVKEPVNFNLNIILKRNKNILNGWQNCLPRVVVIIKFSPT